MSHYYKFFDTNANQQSFLQKLWSSIDHRIENYTIRFKKKVKLLSIKSQSKILKFRVTRVTKKNYN